MCGDRGGSLRDVRRRGGGVGVVGGDGGVGLVDIVVGGCFYLLGL